MSSTDIISILDELTKRLEGPGRYVFEIAVRYQVTDAIISILVGLITLAAGSLAAYGARRAYLAYQASQDGPYTSTQSDLAAIILTIVACLLFTVGILFIAFGGRTLLNPEYEALRSILTTITP